MPLHVSGSMSEHGSPILYAFDDRFLQRDKTDPAHHEPKILNIAITLDNFTISINVHICVLAGNMQFYLVSSTQN